MTTRLFSLMILLMGLGSCPVSAQPIRLLDTDSRQLRRELGIQYIYVLRYNPKDTLSHYKVVHEYDTSGNKLLEKTADKSTETKTYKYDELGQIKVYETWVRGELSFEITYKYSKDPLSVEEVHIDYDNGKRDVHYTSKKFFNDDSLLIRSESNLFGDKLMGIYTYNDKKQQTVNYSLKLPSMDTITQTFYFYDDLGNKIRELILDETGTITRDERMVYKDGNILSTNIYDKNGNLTSTTEYEYENGQISKYITKFKGKTLMEVERLYDPSGNFIYDAMKREYYKYNTQNLPIEKGKINDDGIYIPAERYEYVFF